MKIKFYLWNIFYDKNFNPDVYIPKDGNATLNVFENLIKIIIISWFHITK